MGTMRFDTKRIEWLPLLLPAGVFLLALIARTLPGARTIDDSYITYRYARNLLAGAGFVFNPGERVMGTTTPLYTALMVIAGAVSGGVNAPFAQISMLVNALADGITCLLLMHLGRRLGFRLAGLGAALTWAVAPFSVTFAIGGLETSLYVLLLTGTVAAYLDRRHILAALLGALAFLTRPDALILIGPVALDRLWGWWNDHRHGRLNINGMVKEWLAFGLPAGVWVVFASLYFSSPIPHSVAAKTIAYQLGREEGLVRLLQHYATPFLEHLTFGTPWIRLGLFLHPFLFLSGAYAAVQRQPRVWPWALYPWLYFGVFALANPLIFRWYLTPPLPAYMLFILGGLEQLILTVASTLKSRAKDAKPASPPGRLTSSFAVILVILAPFLLSLRDWRVHPDHGLQRPAPEMAWYKLELLYRQAAQSLMAHPPISATSQPVLAAGDVGVLGFYTGLPILDTVGLNSAQAMRYYPLDPACYVINYAIPPGLILGAEPDLIVILEVYGRKCLLPAPEFQARYRLRETIPTDIYGSEGMLILERIRP